jgi:Zn-dependent alcohol dehydrogenase
MMRILKKRVNEVEKEIAKENRKESQETTEAVELDEGIQEWGKRLAMAGIIVAGLAGVNSINNAIDNSIPAVKAMNTALEMAQDSGNTELAKMIEKDLSDAKIRLSTGKDLGSVADLQDKYAKFMKTEGLAYETVLQYKLESKIKS